MLPCIVNQCQVPYVHLMGCAFPDTCNLEKTSARCDTNPIFGLLVVVFACRFTGHAAVFCVSKTLTLQRGLTQGLDIGPDSIKLIEDALSDAKTVVWNGPAGVFEFPAFAKVGTVVLSL